MELSRFVGFVDKSLICSICHNVFDNPVQDPDGHVFCRQCIETWIENEKYKCPIDKKRLIVHDLKQANTVKNKVDYLDISCEYKKYGCQQILKCRLLQNHKYDCNFHPSKIIMCTRGCLGMVKISRLAEHSCVTKLKTECTKLQRTTELCIEDVRSLKVQVQNLTKKFIKNGANDILMKNQSLKFVPIIDEESVAGNGVYGLISIAYQNIVLHFEEKYSFEELRYKYKKTKVLLI